MDTSQNLKKNCDVDQHAEKMASVKWFSVFEKPEWLLAISLGIIIFALASPVIFTKAPALIIFDNNSGSIASTFGIMNPFIAIAAAIITFAAFWVQYKANQEMRDDGRKQQVISRFYEMLQIHRDNVNELEWVEKIHCVKETSIKDSLHRFGSIENAGGKQDSIEFADELMQKKGRQIFYYYKEEFDSTYKIIDVIYPEYKMEEKIKKAYNIFYLGAVDAILDYSIRFQIKDVLNQKLNITEFEAKIEDIAKKMNLTKKQTDAFKSVLDTFYLNRDYYSLYPPFMGHFEKMDNYYRHLFLTVKTIAQAETKILSYDEKRDLLGILRAQLTIKEQVMLFYNWFSGHGGKWESGDENGHHFFTQFRMVHNISPTYLVPFDIDGSDYVPIFDNFVNYFRDRFLTGKYCDKKDPMFEFEKWFDHSTFKYE